MLGGVKTASWWSRGPAIVLLLAILLGGGYGLFIWTVGMGHASMQKLAVDEGYCTPPQDCAEVVATLYQVAAERFGMFGAHLDWCLGADSWAEAKVRRGGWLKEIAVWFMYLPCGKLSEGRTTS